MDFYNFTEEEKSVINHNGIDVTKKEFIQQMELNKEITEDEECVLLLEKVKNKVQNLSEEDWKILQNYLPLQLSIEE